MPRFFVVGVARDRANPITTQVQRKGHVAPHEFKARVVFQVFDVALAAGEQVVDADHFIAAGQDAVDQVAAQKAGAAGDQDALGGVVGAGHGCGGGGWRP